jgi:hypothetical protein
MTTTGREREKKVRAGKDAAAVSPIDYLPTLAYNRYPGLPDVPLYGVTIYDEDFFFAMSAKVKCLIPVHN